MATSRDTAVRFRILGSAEVWAGGRRLDLGPPKQRTVLAILALDAGLVVPTETLIHRVWDDSPPREARTALYSYIARLRRIVNDEAAAGTGLVRRSGGYCLDVHPDAVDVQRFRRLAAAARAVPTQERPAVADTSGAAPRAAALDEALSLWRGPAMSDLDGAWVSRTRDALEQQRIGVLVQWAEAEMELGHHDLLVDALTKAQNEHPLEESIAAALIRALHGAGRTARALETYAMVRRRLVDEVGAEPGRVLRQAHVAALADVPAGVDAAADPGQDQGWTDEPVDRPRRPAQLPADVSAFTGRTEELARLDRMLLPRSAAPVTSTPETVDSGGAVVVAGTAGVGKTALAVRWAHRARRSFPDGQLYVDLRGYDPDRPTSAADALAGLLSALGVAAQHIPTGLVDRAALYRTELADRRVLVVLDNAASVEQVRSLLPGSQSCAVIVTSRDSLAGLVARDGARRLDLDLLPAEESVALLRRLIGPRVALEPHAAADLVARCARLPLALRIMAERAVARPAASLAELVADLDEYGRLATLDLGDDPRVAVRAVFSWSIAQLPSPTVNAFALLGLHPGPDLDAAAASALLGVSPAETASALAELTRAHLLQCTQDGRHGMHDLLRQYALELAGALPVDHIGAPTTLALGRLFDHYLGTAAAAVDALYPAEAHHRRCDVPPGGSCTAPRFTDGGAALSWLDAELPALAAGAAHALRHGFERFAIGLSTVLFRYLQGGHFQTALLIHGCAREAARRTGDLSGEALALHSLGSVHMLVGARTLAVDHLSQALALAVLVDDRTGQARAHGNLGSLQARAGRSQEAAEHFERAITLYRDCGDRTGEARALGNLGILNMRLGQYERSVTHHTQAVDLFVRLGDRTGQAVALNNLADVEGRVGRTADAQAHREQSLALACDLGDRSSEAWALTGLGDDSIRSRRPGLALRHYRRALDLFRDCGERDAEPWALNGLGEAALELGDPAAALVHHTDAFRLAVDIPEHSQEARARQGLGRAHHALGARDLARHHWRQALRLYRDLGDPNAEVVARHARQAGHCLEGGHKGA